MTPEEHAAGEAILFNEKETDETRSFDSRIHALIIEAKIERDAMAKAKEE
jgi:hypothetical protein